MIARKICSSVIALATLSSSALARVEIELDLASQRAYLLQDGNVVADSPISSGRPGRPTPTGQFSVIEKELDHRSTLYGKVQDAQGRVVKGDADSSTPVPKGGHFVRAPMHYFMRFHGAIGMHAGILPGYAASHGCVRLPSDKAALFYQSASVGTPVLVSSTPRRYTETRKQARPWAAARMEERSTVPMTASTQTRLPFFQRLFH